ncbi:hypothetical protein TNCV_4058911 [Trichonephila clavipes]|nr:hypothetical protein TNCV_4058911 [Trichonephila clavipes]
MEKKHMLARSLINEDWLGKLSYMDEIFENLNDLNMSLQEESANTFTFSSKIEACDESTRVLSLILWAAVAQWCSNGLQSPFFSLETLSVAQTASIHTETLFRSGTRLCGGISK